MTGEGRSIGALAGRGAAWSTLDVTVARLGQFAQGVIVARLLAPDDFGVFAMALVVHNVVINVSELGVSVALIRDGTERIRGRAPTVATISLVSATALGALMAVTAPWTAGFLGSPGAAAVIAVMALNLPLAGLSAVPSAVIKRDFRMDRLFVANATNTAATAVAVVVLARAGWGPMALAVSWVAGQSMTVLLLLTYRPGRHWPGWDTAVARELLAFGLPLAGASLLSFLVLNVDYVVVGRVLGATGLGLYLLAFNISGWPTNVFGTVVRSVSLPGFARLRERGDSLPEHFVTALRLVAAVAVPLCLVLGALARPLIVTVYGGRWAPAAGALTGLAVLGALRIIMELCADYLVAEGRTRAVLAVQVPWLLALTLALVVLVPAAGVVGAGVAQSLVAAAITLPLYLACLRSAGVRLGALAPAVLPGVAWSAVAAAAAFFVAQVVPHPALAVVAGATLAGALAALPHRRELRGAARAWRARRSTDAGGTAPATGALTAEPVGAEQGRPMPATNGPGAVLQPDVVGERA